MKNLKREIYLFLIYLYSKLHKKRIVCFGTSLTAGSGWVKMLRKKMKGWAVINSGCGGMNSNWGIDNFHKLVLRYKPTIVLMEFAVNDCYIGKPYYEKPNLTDSINNISTLIRTFQRHGIKVYLLGMNPPFNKFCFNRNPFEDRPCWEEYYLSHELRAYYYGIPYIDITSKWQELDEKALDLYITDRLHSTEAGSKEIIVPEILKFIGE